jgi:hypothetical protein
VDDAGGSIDAANGAALAALATRLPEVQVVRCVKGNGIGSAEKCRIGRAPVTCIAVAIFAELRSSGLDSGVDADVSRCIDLVDDVVSAVGDLEIAFGVHGHPLQLSELGICSNTGNSLGREGRCAISGDGGDQAGYRIDAIDGTSRIQGDVNVPGRIDEYSADVTEAGFARQFCPERRLEEEYRNRRRR